MKWVTQTKASKASSQRMLQSREFFNGSLRPLIFVQNIHFIVKTTQYLCKLFYHVAFYGGWLTWPFANWGFFQAFTRFLGWAVLKREMSWNLLDYFQTGFELRLVAELAAVDALLADDAADRLDKREFWRLLLSWLKSSSSSLSWSFTRSSG